MPMSDIRTIIPTFEKRRNCCFKFNENKNIWYLSFGTYIRHHPQFNRDTYASRCFYEKWKHCNERSIAWSEFCFFRIVFTFILTFSIFRQTQSRLKFWNCLDLFHALVDYSGPKSWITSTFFPRCRVVQITGETITLELSFHFHKM